MLIIADPQTPQGDVLLEAAAGISEPYIFQANRMGLHGFKVMKVWCEGGKLFITFDVSEERKDEFQRLINQDVPKP